jgi:hypothetical protein
VPVPFRQTVTVGFAGSFVENVAVAERAPSAPGVNFTVKFADDPGAMFDAVGGVMLKSAGFVPPIETPVMFSGLAPAGDVFVIVIVPPALVGVPTVDVCVVQPPPPGAVTVAVG